MRHLHLGPFAHFGHGRSAGGRPSEGDPRPGRRVGAALVLVAPTLANLVPGLAALLGDGYQVEQGLPDDDAVSVLRAPTPPTVAFWRARYPTARLVVVDPWEDGRAVDTLAAGADAYLGGPATVAEIAEILCALAGRDHDFDVRQPA